MTSEYNQTTINLKDNSPKSILDIGLSDDIIENFKNQLYEICSYTIKELQNNNDILFFSNKISHIDDGVEDYHIFHFNGSIINTTNVVGFLSLDNVDINIKSRFSREDDYFFYYLLSKVFDINITALEHSFTNDRGFSFLLFLFPYYFAKALKTGIYKKYVTIYYNNSNVKGTIDFKRHLKYNLIDKSRIAYDTCEHSINNNITQLIRHTIEYIKTKPMGNVILKQKHIKEYINYIVQATPDYNKNQRQTVISNNLKKLVHPYYYEYEPLRKLCVQILRHEKLLYNESSKKVYGILFNIAWLWEEYVNILLFPLGFAHYGKKIKNGANIYLLKNSIWQVFPDFVHDANKVVLDTKYKDLDKEDYPKAADKHQLISYMYTLQSIKGGFVYPSNRTRDIKKYGEVLNIENSHIGQYPLFIPYNIDTMESFLIYIKEEENNFKNFFYQQSV